MNQSETVKMMAKLLRKKFPNLTSIEAVVIASGLLEAIDKAAQKETKSTSGIQGQVKNPSEA